MCGGQTELRRALTFFQFKNPHASVSFHNGGLVNIIVDERELTDLETHLDNLSAPHKVVSLSTKYTKNGKTYNHNLYNMVQHINASNIGKVKKGAPITYFDNLAKDTDEHTKDLSNLAGDDSGSYGSPKTTSITLQDSEAPSASSSSTVGVCGTVQPLYGRTCPTGYFYFDDMTGNPSQYPCVPNGNTCDLETGQQ
jgi:hypothetical protein